MGLSIVRYQISDETNWGVVSGKNINPSQIHLLDRVVVDGYRVNDVSTTGPIFLAAGTNARPPSGTRVCNCCTNVIITDGARRSTLIR